MLVKSPGSTVSCINSKLHYGKLQRPVSSKQLLIMTLAHAHQSAQNSAGIQTLLDVRTPGYLEV